MRPLFLPLGGLLLTSSLLSAQVSEADPSSAWSSFPAGFRFGSAGFAHDSAGHWSAGRPDGHAPIGVMADHMHAEGE